MKDLQLCVYCDKAFLNVRDLKNHMSSHNLELCESGDENQEVSCDKCPKVFDSVKDWISHNRDEHMKEKESAVNKNKQTAQGRTISRAIFSFALLVIF